MKIYQILMQKLILKMSKYQNCLVLLKTQKMKSIEAIKVIIGFIWVLCGSYMDPIGIYLDLMRIYMDYSKNLWIYIDFSIDYTKNLRIYKVSGQLQQHQYQKKYLS